MDICVCACYEFDHMHCWQYVALCKTCKPDLNVSELKGLSRNDLFSYISFHMTPVGRRPTFIAQLTGLGGGRRSSASRRDLGTASMIWGQIRGASLALLALW